MVATHLFLRSAFYTTSRLPADRSENPRHWDRLAGGLPDPPQTVPFDQCGLSLGRIDEMLKEVMDFEPGWDVNLGI